ncbi:uncharacterized protein EV422DRAFT_597291 [Fimicolochytrium jonesii]|uniref:uncharacterized protein n=1 Tax=Fimicolochytrium jonesii TaxID=1396493 RepID=UPI0022FE1DBC|nr:uncharacterized protein EV422DRAFT_597291 [Fimicolochytrium jonesii]KAI8820244.1 hypothetical protein EV422DRAFT_597291 [Fimicolochytrium jonesii]
MSWEIATARRLVSKMRVRPVRRTFEACFEALASASPSLRVTHKLRTSEGNGLFPAGILWGSARTGRWGYESSTLAMEVHTAQYHIYISGDRRKERKTMTSERAATKTATSATTTTNTVETTVVHVLTPEKEWKPVEVPLPKLTASLHWEEWERQEGVRIEKQTARTHSRHRHATRPTATLHCDYSDDEEEREVRKSRGRVARSQRRSHDPNQRRKSSPAGRTIGNSLRSFCTFCNPQLANRVLRRHDAHEDAKETDSDAAPIGKEETMGQLRHNGPLHLHTRATYPLYTLATMLSVEPWKERCGKSVALRRGNPLHEKSGKSSRRMKGEGVIKAGGPSRGRQSWWENGWNLKQMVRIRGAKAGMAPDDELLRVSHTRFLLLAIRLGTGVGSESRGSPCVNTSRSENSRYSPVQMICTAQDAPVFDQITILSRFPTLSLCLSYMVPDSEMTEESPPIHALQSFVTGHPLERVAKLTRERNDAFGNVSR